MEIALVVFRIEGEKIVKQSMENLEKDVKKGAEKVVNNLAEWGSSFAKTRAPIDTSALIRAISYRHVSKAKSLIISDQPVHPKKGTRVPYHIFIETGTVPPSWGTKKGTRDRLFYFTKTAEAVKGRIGKDMEIQVSNAVVRND